MKKFGEGQQPFYAIVDIPEGDAQELTTVTDQVLNSLYGEFFNLLQAHGINPTTTTSADLKQVARAVWSAVATANSFIDTGSADIKNLTHIKGGSFLYKNGVSADDGFTIEFVNKTANTGSVKINVFDVENNSNHFNLVPLLNNNGNELTSGALRAGVLVKARYDVAKNAFIMTSQFVAAAYVIDGDKTQEQINALQKRKNAELVSIYDFFTDAELAAYRANVNRFDASKQLQAFFDYIIANDVGIANASGVFKTSKQINFVGAAKTNRLVGMLNLTPLAGFAGNAVFYVSANEIAWYGGINVQTGSYIYANRLANTGVLIGTYDNAMASRCFIDEILASGYKHYGVKIRSGATGMTIRKINVHANGTGKQADARYSAPAVNLSGRSDVSTGGTESYTEYTADSLPPADYDGYLHLLLNIKDKNELFTVTSIDRNTNKIRISPNVDYDVTGNLTGNYVWGAGVYTIGGDTSVLNIGNIWGTANSYTIWEGALYPAQIGAIISEMNLGTICLGAGLADAVVGGTVNYIYTESNIFDFVLTTRYTPNFRFLNDVTFDLDKVQILGRVRSAQRYGNYIANWNDFLGVIGTANGVPFKHQGKLYEDSTEALDLTALKNGDRFEPWGDYGSLTIPLQIGNEKYAKMLGYLKRRLVVFCHRTADLSAANTLTFTAPNGYTFQNGNNTFVNNGINGLTEFIFTLDVGRKKVFVGKLEKYKAPTQLAASVLYDPPSIANAAQQTTTINLVGAKIGDIVGVGFSSPLTGTRLWGEVTSADIVTVYHRNDTGAAVDVTSGTLTVKIL